MINFIYFLEKKLIYNILDVQGIYWVYCNIRINDTSDNFII
jgi:hypothetical protein